MGNEKNKTLPDWIKILMALLGGGGIIGLYALWNQISPPKFTVENHLALPVMVYVNDNPAYTVRISPNSSVEINLIGNSEFPATVKWEMLQDTNSSGQQLGASLNSVFTKAVEKNSTISIKNVWDGYSYFYPILSNATDQPCNIVINDGLLSQANPGFLNPHKKNIAPGYYKWTANSNVTLLCANQTYWWGARNGKDGGAFRPGSENGIIPIGIP